MVNVNGCCGLGAERAMRPATPLHRSRAASRLWLRRRSAMPLDAAPFAVVLLQDPTCWPGSLTELRGGCCSIACHPMPRHATGSLATCRGATAWRPIIQAQISGDGNLVQQEMPRRAPNLWHPPILSWSAAGETARFLAWRSLADSAKTQQALFWNGAVEETQG